MTKEEFSNQFSVLYNNVTSNQAPGLSEYEKSVFLTKGQDEVLKNYFLPQSNSKQAGYDDNQKRQIDFSMITKVYTVGSQGLNTAALYDGHSNSVNVALPTDVMMIINERVTVTRNSTTGVGLVVRALQFDDYDKLMSKPFTRPLKNQAWRIIVSETAGKADLIVGPKDTITSYVIRYVKRPKPIITGDLDGLTIHGYYLTGGTAPAAGAYQTTDGECELDPILHEEILQRAVELAKVAWTATGGDNTQAVMAAGQRSE